MLVGTVVVTALFAAALVTWQIATGGDDGTTARTAPSWSSIAVVDRVTGDVTYIGPDGDVVGTSEANGRTGSVHGVGGSLTLISSQRAAVLPPPNSEDAALVVEMPRGATVGPVAGGDVTYLAVGTTTGGNVIVLDPAAATAYDIGALVAGTLPSTPAMRVDTLRTNRDGSIIAVADVTNFQTIVVQPDTTVPVFLPDQPVAAGDDLVATSQTVGTQADVALVALDGSTKASVPTEIPVGGVFDDDRFVFVSIDGGVFGVEPGDDEADQIGVISIPVDGTIAWARPASDGRRLVVTSETFEAVVDLDGETLFSTTFAGPVEAVAPDPDWACLPVGGTGGSHSIIDLDTGEQLADLTGLTITGVADHGCAVLADRNGIASVVTGDGVAVLGRVTSSLIGPDGRSVVRTTADGITELVLLGDDLAITDTIDITEAIDGANPLITFVTSID